MLSCHLTIISIGDGPDPAKLFIYVKCTYELYKNPSAVVISEYVNMYFTY